MNQATFITKLGGRKFVLVLFCCIAALVLCCLGLMHQDNVVKVWGSAIALYGLANVSQKATAKKADSTTSTPT